MTPNHPGTKLFQGVARCLIKRAGISTKEGADADRSAREVQIFFGEGYRLHNDLRGVESGCRKEGNFESSQGDKRRSRVVDENKAGGSNYRKDCRKSVIAWFSRQLAHLVKHRNREH